MRAAVIAMDEAMSMHGDHIAMIKQRAAERKKEELKSFTAERYNFYRMKHRSNDEGQTARVTLLLESIGVDAMRENYRTGRKGEEQKLQWLTTRLENRRKAMHEARALQAEDLSEEALRQIHKSVQKGLAAQQAKDRIYDAEILQHLMSIAAEAAPLMNKIADKCRLLQSKLLEMYDLSSLQEGYLVDDDENEV